MLAFRSVAELVNGIPEEIESINATMIKGRNHLHRAQQRATHIATVIGKGINRPRMMSVAGAAVPDEIDLPTMEGLPAAR